MIEPLKGIAETVSGNKTFDRLDVQERVIITGTRTLAFDKIANVSVGADEHWPAKLMLLACGVLTGVVAFAYPLLSILSLVLIVSAVFVRATQTLVIVTSDGTKTRFSSAQRAELDEVLAFLTSKINTNDEAATGMFVFAAEAKPQPVATHHVPVAETVATTGFEPMTSPTAPIEGPASVEPPFNTPQPIRVPVSEVPASQMPTQTPEFHEHATAASRNNPVEPVNETMTSDVTREFQGAPSPVNATRASPRGGLLHSLTPASSQGVDAASPDFSRHHVDYSVVLNQVTELNRFYAKTPDTQHIEERLSEMEVLMRSGTPNADGQERIRVLCGELSTILQVYPTMVQLFDGIAGLTQQQAA